MQMPKFNSAHVVPCRLESSADGHKIEAPSNRILWVLLPVLSMLQIIINSIILL